MGDEPSGDAALWQRARRHDGEAFGLLFDRHHNAVYRHCRRRLDTIAAAEDLVSMTFLEAWRKRSKAEITSESMLPWLLTIANNLIANQVRAARRYRSLLNKLPAYHEDQPAAEDHALDSLVAEELSRTTAQALNALRPEEQEVVKLYHYDGFSQAVIAQRLDIPVGTVKSRLHRAAKALRMTLADPDTASPLRPQGRSHE